MPLIRILGILLGICLFGAANIAAASEADELRARAKAILKEAASLASKGKEEEAHRLEKEAAKLLEAAEHVEMKAKGATQEPARKEIEILKNRLQDLLAQELKLKATNAPEEVRKAVREQIEQHQHHLHAIQAASANKIQPQVAAQVEKLENASRAVFHLRAASEHLKRAGSHELAMQLMEKAEVMERNIQDAKKELENQLRKHQPSDQGLIELRELRAELERLRAEVKELKQKVEKR